MRIVFATSGNIKLHCPIKKDITYEKTSAILFRLFKQSISRKTYQRSHRLHKNQFPPALNLCVRMALSNYRKTFKQK